MKSYKTNLVFLFILLCLRASAQVPTSINYQGKLVDGTNLVNGMVSLAFRFYNNPTNASMPIYEDSNDVAVVDGLYSTTIGDHPVWGQLDNILGETSVWVEVAVDGVTMAPREKVLSVVYARWASGVPADAIKTHMIDDNQIYSQHQFLGRCVGFRRGEQYDRTIFAHERHRRRRR